MHEASLVKTLLAQVDQIRREQGDCQVSSISVSYGPLSGIEPDFFCTAYDRQRQGTSCEQAKLELIFVRLIGVCEHCEVESAFEELEFECPICHQRKMCFRSGQEVQLEFVTLLLQDTGEIAK